MKNIFPFIALCLLLTACSRRDATISKEITGVWAHSPDYSEQYNPNGSYLTISRNYRGTNVYAGTWLIKNGVMTEVLTNVSGPKSHARVGDIVHLKIISADAHHMTIEIGGHTEAVSR